MARARNIKPAFFKNEDLVELPFEYRLLFVGLWTVADREGRLEDRPKRIKMELFPADNVDVSDGLAKLEKLGFIDRYEIDGVKVVSIRNFHRHQSPHHTERKSELPDINGEYTGVSPLNNRKDPGESRKQDGENRPDSLIPDSLIQKNLVGDSEESRDDEKKPAIKKFTDEDQDAANAILRDVQEIAPSTKGSTKWADCIRLMRERDGRTHAEILEMFRWANTHSFWRANILSPAKLREKWPQLEAKRNSEKPAEEQPQQSAWHETASGIREQGKRHGLTEDQFSSFYQFKQAVFAAEGIAA